MPKKMVLGSMGVAGFVAFLALLDLAVKIPFGGASPLFNILFLAASGILVYIAYDTYQEMQ